MSELKNNLKIPQCLSKELFEECLQNKLKLKSKNDIQIDNLDISLGSGAGENYTSVIYRAKIRYHIKNVSNSNAEHTSFIIKSILLAENARDIHELDAFNKEIKMYLDILPRIEKLYKNIETFVPKCYHVIDQPDNKSMIFQDLVDMGFVLADRVKRLDEAHAKIVLRKLARYHAGTMVLLKQEPELLKYFDKGFFHASSYNMDAFQNIFIKGYFQITELISKWNGFENIAKKLKNMEKNLEKKVCDVLSSKPNEIRVLNHSDCWTNNMLFLYSENGNVSDMNFIDLQISTNGSLGMDINYFLHTSIQFEVVKTKREELLKHYYQAFQGGLKELNYPNIPTWEKVRNDIESKELFGFLTLIGISPIICLDRDVSKDSSYDTIMDGDAMSKNRARVYSYEKFNDFLKFSIKRFDELGLFE